MDRIRVAVIGCGCISETYLRNLTGMLRDVIDVRAVCDIIPERALAAQEKYNIPKAYFTDEEVLADPEIEAVLNITPPQEHCKVNMLALRAGKHAYCEKPLACTLEDGRRQIVLAEEKGLLLGGAPDTFLGAGIRTCKTLIDAGVIGTPVAAQAQLLGHGPESWHPDPGFFYRFGAGPLFDMGPYYVTALTYLLGSVDTVRASCRASFAERVATCREHYGEHLPIEIPTHCAAILGFASGAVGMLTTSFDVYETYEPYPITVYGEKGSLRVPDPNCFKGPAQLLRAGSKEWEESPVLHPYSDESRGIGFADFCRCVREGGQPAGSCRRTGHVLEVLCAVYESGENGREVKLRSDLGEEKQ